MAVLIAGRLTARRAALAAASGRRCAFCRRLALVPWPPRFRRPGRARRRDRRDRRRDRRGRRRFRLAAASGALRPPRALPASSSPSAPASWRFSRSSGRHVAEAAAAALAALTRASPPAAALLAASPPRAVRRRLRPSALAPIARAALAIAPALGAAARCCVLPAGRRRLARRGRARVAGPGRAAPGVAAGAQDRRPGGADWPPGPARSAGRGRRGRIRARARAAWPGSARRRCPWSAGTGSPRSGCAARCRAARSRSLTFAVMPGFSFSSGFGTSMTVE